MAYILSLFSGLLFANGIPHFVNGISGKEFHNPSLHRVFPNVPSPLFNVIWGLCNFVVAAVLSAIMPGLQLGFNARFLSFCAGFGFAAIGLSMFFSSRKQP